MNFDASVFEEIHQQHGSAGSVLYDVCKGELFPCDILAYSVLERSLHLIRSFSLIVADGGYSSAMALLRIQLDNILRLNGVIVSGDPHNVANRIMQGDKLSSIKDQSGQKMFDKRLVELLNKKNTWIEDVYELASSYIHLSKEHTLHFILRCPINPDGTRLFCVGDNEDYISIEHKEKLINAFIVVSRAIPILIQEWAQNRHICGSNEDLKMRFEKNV